MRKINERYVSDYLQYLRIKGDKINSIQKCQYLLNHYTRGLEKDLLAMTKEEVQLKLLEIMEKPLSIATYEGIKGYVKSLYYFLGYDASFIRTRRMPKQLDPSALLSEEEVIRMLKQTKHPRNRAIILLLWDTGIRTQELITMQVSSVDLQSYPPHISVNGKTGIRKIPIHSNTAEAISKYISAEPRFDDGALFIPYESWRTRKRLTADGVNKMLREAAAAAGINKKMSVYTFRHSVATRDAKYYTEPLMRAKFGWAKDSAMTSTYVHLSARDLDEAMQLADRRMPSNILFISENNA